MLLKVEGRARVQCRAEAREGLSGQPVVGCCGLVSPSSLLAQLRTELDSQAGLDLPPLAGCRVTVGERGGRLRLGWRGNRARSSTRRRGQAFRSWLTRSKGHDQA